jgi:integrase
LPAKDFKGITKTSPRFHFHCFSSFITIFHISIPAIPAETEPSDTASPLLSSIWERYKESIYSSLELSTIETKNARSGFIVQLGKYQINEITADLIDKLLRENKAKNSENSNSKRCDFNKELKELRAVFNWYRENVEYTFINPILKRHFKIGKIRPIKEKHKKMAPAQVVLFLNSLKEHCSKVMYDFGRTQLFTASRVQEIAGLQKESVDLKNRQLRIKDVVVWNRKKQFVCLKSKPKNNEVKYCTITNSMSEPLRTQIESSSKDCSYVFQIDGKPLSYRHIQYNYNKALKKCGLDDKFSSTHIMKHSMAFITRMVTGSIDSTQAVTGHKDIRMVQHYSGGPDNKPQILRTR